MPPLQKPIKRKECDISLFPFQQARKRCKKLFPVCLSTNTGKELKMFAVMYETEDGKMFKVYDDLSSAQYAAQNAVCGTGWKATIFDYDSNSKSYIEFYTV